MIAKSISTQTHSRDYPGIFALIWTDDFASFHELCGRAVKLSHHNEVAEASGIPCVNDVAFSSVPLYIGEEFLIKVEKSKLPLCIPGLYLGVTELSPQEWREDGEKHPGYMTRTWCLYTADGKMWINGSDAGPCLRWGRGLQLSDGDTLAVTFCDDRSVSVTYNDTEIPQVFKDLPAKPLWFIVHMQVNKLRVLDP